MDRQRLEGFVRGDYPAVVAAVGFACGDVALAEDAIQEVLASLLERGDVGGVDNLAGWIVTAALNRTRSTHRRRRSELRAVERLRAAPQAGSTGPEVDDDVMAALRGLPERQREIAALHYLLDMSVVDTAHALGVTDGTVKTQLHRAREALRARLAPTVAAEPDNGPESENGEVDHVRR